MIRATPSHRAPCAGERGPSRRVGLPAPSATGRVARGQSGGGGAGVGRRPRRVARPAASARGEHGGQSGGGGAGVGRRRRRAGLLEPWSLRCAPRRGQRGARGAAPHGGRADGRARRRRRARALPARAARRGARCGDGGGQREQRAGARVSSRDRAALRRRLEGPRGLRCLLLARERQGRRDEMRRRRPAFDGRRLALARGGSRNGMCVSHSGSSLRSTAKTTSPTVSRGLEAYADWAPPAHEDDDKTAAVGSEPPRAASLGGADEAADGDGGANDPPAATPPPPAAEDAAAAPRCGADAVDDAARDGESNDEPGESRACCCSRLPGGREMAGLRASAPAVDSNCARAASAADDPMAAQCVHTTSAARWRGLDLEGAALFVFSSRLLPRE